MQPYPVHASLGNFSHVFSGQPPLPRSEETTVDAKVSSWLKSVPPSPSSALPFVPVSEARASHIRTTSVLIYTHDI